MARVWRVVGGVLVLVALWGAIDLNVDADVPSGPTNCGRGAVAVLIDGPSRNTDVLSDSDCRASAAIGVAVFAVLAGAGLFLAVGLGGRWLTGIGRHRLPSGTGVVPLKRYRVNWRPPYLHADGISLTIVLPRYFGSTEWRVPIREVAVADLTAVADTDEDAEAVFEDPVNLPNFPTTGAFTSPGVVVLFREPQRVPVLRRSVAWDRNVDVGFTRRASMSPAGARIDGFMVRVTDPAGAVATLAAGGAEVTTDPDRWLVTHRRTSTDPAAIAQAEQELATAQRLDRFGLTLPSVALGVGVLLARFAGGVLETVGLVVAGAAVAALAVHQVVVWRRGRRRAT